MQNAQMAAMANMNPGAGPMDGTPIMGNGPRQPGPGIGDPRDQLNTYIYDYFLRNNYHKLAQVMIESELKMNLKPPQKSSPSGRNVNGVDAMDTGDLPLPNMPSGQATDNSFLLDWWQQFWDIFSAARGRNNKGSQYIQHTRNAMQAQAESRNQRMMMNGANYTNMLRQAPNGVGQNDLKRTAAMNNRPNGNPMAGMNQMQNKAMMAAQMQRDGSQMDMNGQRPPSPGSNENGGSPNKRPRVEGAMNAGNMPGNQFGEFAQQGPNAQQKQIEGMNNVAQGSPMNQQGLTGEQEIFVGNHPRPGIPAGAPPPQGNHALQDYQMQLMLLEQQNKKRLLMARQEQDSMSGPHAQGGVGGPGFPASMSPQGSRAGPSPNPSDQMKKGATPRMGPQGLPGSPMPEGAMQPQRNSPAPGVAFDPSQMPPGMPPQYNFPPNQMNNPMMRPPPSSHPQFTNGQPVTPQQMELMRANQIASIQNGGAWRGPPGQPGLIPGQQQMGPMGANPQRQMPPPPAPAGEQPRTQEPSPSQPPAPPTPSTGNKANPKKKNTKDNKKPANKKGANTGATPAASGGEEPATPTAPITPVHPKQSFGQGPNGQQAPQAAQSQPPAQPQQPPMDNNSAPGAFGSLGDDNFDNLSLGFDDPNALENFDFESFLHVGDDSTGFGSLGADFTFGDGLEATGE